MTLRRPASWALALAMAASVAFNVVVTRGATFFNGDEWNMLLLRRPETGAGAFLEPNNQHITVLPTAIYKLLFAVFGGTTNVPARIVVALLVCACAGVVALYLRPLVGRVPAVCAGVLVCFLGTGWEDVMWGFQMGFLTSLLGGIGSLLVIARRPRHDALLIFALLLCAVLSSNVGLPMAVGAGVALVLRGRRRQLWAAAVPLVLWLVWFATYGRDGPSNVGLTSLLNTPEFILRSIAVACAGLSGLASPLIEVPYPRRGYLLGGALGAVLILLVLAAARRRGLRPGLVAAVVMVLLYWGTLALNSDVMRPPEASRYLLPGAVLTLLVLGEALAELPASVAGTARTWLPRLAVVGLALALVGNVHYYLAGARSFRADGAHAKAVTGAMLLARETIQPTYAVPSSEPGAQFLGTIFAGSVLEADRAVGVPADSEAEIAAAPPIARRLADVVAYAAGRPQLGDFASSSSCTAVPAGGGVVPLGRGGVAVRVGRGGVVLEVRRWGPSWVPAGSVPASAGAVTFSIRRRPDAARTPWQLRLRSPAPVRACALPG